MSKAEFDEVLAGARQRYEQSQDFTLGIEEEWALLDPETLDLVPEFERAREAAVRAGLGTSVAGELLASEIEFLIEPCERWEDAVRAMRSLRNGVAGVLRSCGLEGAISGTHPWADYRTQVMIDAPYYNELVRRMQYVARRNNTFGLHVHVGVHGADRAVRVSTALRNIQPLMLALSASSPFLDGCDSGLCSARTMTFSRTFPRGNIAPRFDTLDDYTAYLRLLYETDSIFTPNQVWWGARPHIRHGTVELRMFDGQPDLEDTLALAALAVGTVAHLCDLDDAGELPVAQPAYLVDENLWRAMRSGTDARMIALPEARTAPVHELVSELVAAARAASARHSLGLDPGLDRVLVLLERGSSAIWQREAAEAAGGDLMAAYRKVAAVTMAQQPAAVV